MALNKSYGWLYSTSLEDKAMAVTSPTKMCTPTTLVFSHFVINPIKMVSGISFEHTVQLSENALQEHSFSCFVLAPY
jgi:hypothetical protein